MIRRRVFKREDLGILRFRRRRRVASGVEEWTQERTRWPERAALKAVAAVSSSLISPIMMTSGSWRRKALRVVLKVIFFS